MTKLLVSGVGDSLLTEIERGPSSDAELLRALAWSVPLIQQLFPLDCAVAVSDGRRFLAVVAGRTVDPDISPGDEIPAEDVNPEVMRTGLMQSAVLSAEAYGVPMRSIVVPIKNPQGKVVGTLDIGIDLSVQVELQDIADRIRDFFNQITQNSEQLSDMACQLSSAQQELQEITTQATGHLKKTNSILDLIQSLAGQANLLGINAAIEAARSGDHGRGFAVVADEIRNMSNRTAKSADEINSILKEFSQFISKVTEFVDHNERRASELAAASEEMTSTLEDKTQAVERLHQLSLKL